MMNNNYATRMVLNVQVKVEVTRERVHKPEGPAPAAVETRAGGKGATGTNIATVPACAPSAYWEI